MKVSLNRDNAVIAALIVGLLIGLALGAYVFYAIFSADVIMKNASPKFLNSDPVSQTPQYRDFYVVRAANKYQHDVQTGVPDQLRGAEDVLGVTSGDTSMEEAIAMVRASEKVVGKENNSDGDAGLFTRNEELAMGALAGALDKALQSGNYPKIDPSKYAPLQSKTTVRIVGAVVWLLLSGLGVWLILWMNRRTRSGESVAQTTGLFSKSVESLTFREPAQHDPVALTRTPDSVAHNSTVNLSPTSPGAAPSAGDARPSAGDARPSIFAAPSSRLTSPVISGEAPISTFAPTVYRHGDDHYDEDFAINGPLGELVGECGASIADRIGLDAPSRVSALSLWVFDKNDFQSTTKVLMTNYAWNDTVTRSKLKARGEAVQAMDGGVIEILTSTLRVEAQVSDLTYNTDKNPDHGYFQNVTLTFRVFKRQASA